MAKHPTFNSIRRREFDARLEEAGFCRGKKIWYRHAGLQIHGVDLQRRTSFGEFTFNLMFHYEFIPNLWKFTATDLESEFAVEVAFMLRSRLGRFIIVPGERVTQYGDVRIGCDKWWQFDVLPEVQAATLKDCAEKCLSVFDQYGMRWHDPEWFLEHITPQALCSAGQHKDDKGVDDAHVPYKALVPWRFTTAELSYSLSVIAVQKGHRELAREYAEIAATCPQTVISKPAICRLLDELKAED